MTDQTQNTKTVDAEDAQCSLPTLIDAVVGLKARVIVQRDGKAVAALISAADLARFEHLEQQRAERYKIVEEIQDRFTHLDPEEVERDIAEAITEVCAEARSQRAAASRT